MAVKKTTAKESPIHIKLEYLEAVKGKRDLLDSQLNLLNLMKILRNYNEFRQKELEKKQQIFKITKEVRINLSKLQKIMPLPKIPKILKKGLPEKTYSAEPKIDTIDHTDVESQLREIQEKLRQLQE